EAVDQLGHHTEQNGDDLSRLPRLGHEVPQDIDDLGFHLHCSFLVGVVFVVASVESSSTLRRGADLTGGAEVQVDRGRHVAGAVAADPVVEPVDPVRQRRRAQLSWTICPAGVSSDSGTRAPSRPAWDAYAISGRRGTVATTRKLVTAA